MGADYYFRMGSTHSICQDYALAGESSSGIPYAILSDGCSGISNPEQPGSPYTDFGARFLVLSALRNLEAIADCQFPFVKIIADADAMRRQASLPTDSLDATLLMVAEKNGTISVGMTGDGVLVFRYRSGLVETIRRQFENGMPAYLSYQIKTNALENYLSKSKSYTEFIGTKTEENYKEESVTTDNGFSLQGTYIRQTLFRKDIDLVLLFSDGIESFIDSKTNQPIPFTKVLDVVLDLPRMTGQFVTRSCNYLLKKHCIENGWVHHDDFSCAGIYLP